jgi:hypothetical protein
MGQLSLVLCDLAGNPLPQEWAIESVLSATVMLEELDRFSPHSVTVSVAFRTSLTLLDGLATVQIVDSAVGVIAWGVLDNPAEQVTREDAHTITLALPNVTELLRYATTGQGWAAGSNAAPLPLRTIVQRLGALRHGWSAACLDYGDDPFILAFEDATVLGALTETATATFAHIRQGRDGTGAPARLDGGADGYEYHVVNAASLAAYNAQFPHEGEFRSQFSDSTFAYSADATDITSQEQTERALYVAAKAQLAWYGMPQRTVTVTTVGVGRPPRAGSRVTLGYRRIGTDERGAFAALDEGGTYTIVAVQRAYDDQGAAIDTWTLTNNGRQPPDAAGAQTDATRALVEAIRSVPTTVAAPYPIESGAWDIDAIHSLTHHWEIPGEAFRVRTPRRSRRTRTAASTPRWGRAARPTSATRRGRACRRRRAAPPTTARRCRGMAITPTTRRSSAASASTRPGSSRTSGSRMDASSRWRRAGRRRFRPARRRSAAITATPTRSASAAAGR